jgi:hypothetical protein
MRDFVTWLVGNPAHRAESFLRGRERRIVAAIVAALPETAEPAQLSLIGALGAVGAAAALIASHSWPWAIWLAPVAMGVNWLGLTVDLPLARAHGGEAPVDGMAHHLSEIFSQLTILVAYGFSPFLTMRAATIIIVCFLLFSSYAYIRAATRHVEQMSYLGIGVTEFRILLAFWPFAALALGVPESLGDKFPPIDVAIIAMAGFAILGLVVKLFLDSRKITAAPGRKD